MIWNLATCSGSNSIPEEESRSSGLGPVAVPVALLGLSRRSVTVSSDELPRPPGSDGKGCFHGGGSAVIHEHVPSPSFDAQTKWSTAKEFWLLCQVSVRRSAHASVDPYFRGNVGL